MLTQLASLLISILVGCCIGYLYGLLFVYQKKGAFLNHQLYGIQSSVKQIFLTVIRISMIAIIIWYLLLLPKIDFILVIVSFFLFFWIVVMQYKGALHE